MPANTARPMPTHRTRERVTRVIGGDAFEIIKVPIRLAGVKAPELGTQKGQEVKGLRLVSKKVVASKPKEPLKAAKRALKIRKWVLNTGKVVLKTRKRC